MINCSDCKYWTTKTDSSYPEHLHLGKCLKVKLFGNCIDWDDKGNVTLVDEAKEDIAFVQDASDYRSELVTMGNFGCVEGEKK